MRKQQRVPLVQLTQQATGLLCLLFLQAAQQQMQQQLAAAEQLAAEVEQLKSENLEAWRVKYELEGQMAATKASLEGMQRQGSSMHKVC
jgi:hypothetical protein